MLSINCQKTEQEIVNFIRVKISKTGFKKLIVGLSGGIDSSVVVSLLVKALGKKSVFVALLPYGSLNQNDIKDAYLIINKLKIPSKNIITINIKKIVDKITAWDKKISLIRKGNIIARVRMIYLFDLAKKYKALVCGTENKTEYLLGYYTRFGDQASDIEPIRHLYKTQIFKLAKYLKLPERIINKKPTAGLWPKQTDEEELGFSYKDADIVLHLFFDKKLTKEEIVKHGVEIKTIEKVLAWVKKNEFKHLVPIVIENK